MSDRSNRPGGRATNALRPVSFKEGVQRYAEGSALIQAGNTHVLTAASVESRVPSFLLDTGKGWITAEYSMLPRATHTRNRRESSKGRPGGRTLEIQRLIGRSLRAAVDLGRLGEKSITVDCDVLQADGGTRTASVTGGYVALVQALAKSFLQGDIKEWPVVRQVAAVSVGLVDGEPRLDLEYVEDSAAEVDMNVVATAGGEIIEIQGTGEQRSFTRKELDALLDLAFHGIEGLVQEQNRALASVMADVDDLRKNGRRRAQPKDESTLWGPPTP